MKAKNLSLYTALGLACFSLSSCYTVLQGPKTAADLQKSQELSQGQEKWDGAPTTLGRFQERPDPWNDFYYPNAPSGTYGYDGYGGFPIFGFDSRYGLYGAGMGNPYGYGNGHYPYGYGYASSPYYGYGADPYGYGADPYYRDQSGYYVPPGYELVSTATLDRLRSAEQSLSTQPTVDPDALRREERRRAEHLWDQREQPRRTRPTTTPRAAPASSAKPKSSKPASTSEEDQGSTKPKRRGGR